VLIAVVLGIEDEPVLKDFVRNSIHRVEKPTVGRGGDRLGVDQERIEFDDVLWLLILKGIQRLAPDLDGRSGETEAPHPVGASAILEDWPSSLQ
jgi:hypothetical protein